MFCLCITTISLLPSIVSSLNAVLSCGLNYKAQAHYKYIVKKNLLCKSIMAKCGSAAIYPCPLQTWGYITTCFLKHCNPKTGFNNSFAFPLSGCQVLKISFCQCPQYVGKWHEKFMKLQERYIFFNNTECYQKTVTIRLQQYLLTSLLVVR